MEGLLDTHTRTSLRVSGLGLGLDPGAQEFLEMQARVFRVALLLVPLCVKKQLVSP